jgi:hypothetical protein
LKTKITNWSEYNQSLKEQGDISQYISRGLFARTILVPLMNTRSVLDCMSVHKDKPGNPHKIRISTARMGQSQLLCNIQIGVKVERNI